MIKCKCLSSGTTKIPLKTNGSKSMKSSKLYNNIQRRFNLLFYFNVVSCPFLSLYFFLDVNIVAFHFFICSMEYNKLIWNVLYFNDKKITEIMSAYRRLTWNWHRFTRRLNLNWPDDNYTTELNRWASVDGKSMSSFLNINLFLETVVMTVIIIIIYIYIFNNICIV